ncbi:hypothetical protein WJX72_007062 [[Myrmecia] bisecta]|uniref:Purple acid phosphatase n=1 Tax=[Myrmecia] bisecta TaxID=41462 RepID=A0AAW1P6N0_9CHLO
MGLPGFNSWFSKQHPEAFVSYQRGSFEHVYIDLAGVLHTVLRKAHSERKFHKLLYQRLNEILDRTSPLKSVVFALDGPAPLAKLVTQRRRRQRDDRKEVRDGGQPSQISSLGLTPGTPLMLTIQKSLEVYICSQLQCHRWRNVQFELSGATVVGEGELKIMSRLLCPWAEVEEGDKHLIVGSDSDLILMSLISPADNIYLLMERPDGTNRFMCFAKAVLLRSWSGRLVPKGLTHQAAAQYLDGVARDLAVLSIMGRSNDYLPPVRGAMLEDTGPQKGMWTVYKRMRKQPQWAHQNLIPQQGGKLQLNGAFIAAVLRTQSSQTRTSAPPLVFLQPPDPIEYAQGLVWVVEMYSEAKCLNYRWMHDRAGPWAATMAAALSHAPEFNTPDGPHPALSHAEPTTSSHAGITPRHHCATSWTLTHPLPTSMRCAQSAMTQQSEYRSPSGATWRPGATATAEVDLDADPDLDSDGESGAGSEDSEDLLASATGQLLDADGESSAAESHGCVVRELLARAKELDRAMQAEKVHLKREIQAKEWHEQESHSYVPFPVERLEAAVAAVPLDAYPPAQRVLAEFGRSHRFRSVAVTKAAAGAGMEHSPQTGLSLQKPWPRHPLGRSQYKDHSHHICREALVEGPDDNSSITVAYNTTFPFTNGQWITVSWSGVAAPANTDYIALYPVDFEANVTVSSLVNNTPIKFIYANDSSTYMKSGKGSYSFYLQNLRTSVQFCFMTGGTKKPVIAAKGPVLTPANLNEPTQVHLALTGVNSEMAVMWVTLNASNPHVKWGSAPGVNNSSAPSKPQTYTKKDMCTGFGASDVASTSGWYPPGQNHYAVMTGLKPLTRYYYVVGDEAYGYSAEYSFLSAPVVGPNTAVDIVIMADIGQGQADGSNLSGRWMQPSINTTELIAAETQAQLVLLNGDLAYADGYLLDWDYFGDQMSAIAAYRPLMTIGGNHEYTWPTLTYNGTTNSGYLNTTGDVDSQGECGIPYNQKWVNPNGNAPWYSYDFGPIHLLGMSTEHNFAKGSPQYSFIEADLKAVDRKRTPWLIVNTHRSTFIDQTKPDTVASPALQNSLSPLLEKYKVDLVFSGHTHVYETTCPIVNKTCAGYTNGIPNGPIYIVTGSAGRLSNPTGSTVTAHALNSSIALPPSSSIYSKVQISYGYMRAHVNGTDFVAQAVSSAELGSGYNPMTTAGDDLLHDRKVQPAPAPKANGVNFGADPGYVQIFDFVNVKNKAVVATS